MLILQTVKRHYICAVEYPTYWLTICGARYDDTVFGYITKMVEKVNMKAKAPLLSPSNLVCKNSLSESFRLAWHKNYVHEEANLRVLLFSAKNKLASILNTCMSAVTSTAPAADFADSAVLLGKKNLLMSYFDVVSYLFKKFANSQTVANMDSAILRYPNPPTELRCSMLMVSIPNQVESQMSTKSSLWVTSPSMELTPTSVKGLRSIEPRIRNPTLLPSPSRHSSC